MNARKKNSRKTPTKPSDREAVVVLGMHRSGTSALSRVLTLLGCVPPKTLMGATEFNESGYWESRVIRRFNDEMLSSAGSDWRDWAGVDPNWYESVLRKGFVNKALKIISDEFGDAPLIALKDPRICRIFPLWTEILGKADILPRVILLVRHPVEVASSLIRRDAISEQHASLLWLRYTLDAEFASRGMPRATLLYDDLMISPSQNVLALQDALGVSFPRLSEAVKDEIRSFISPDLRHHSVPQVDEIAEGAFSLWLNEVNRIFVSWGKMGEQADDHIKLDTIREAMDGISGPLREVVNTLTAQSVELEAQKRETAKFRDEAGRLDDNVNELTRDLKAQETKFRDALHEANAELVNTLTRQSVELEVQKRETAKFRDEAGRLDGHVKELKRDLQTRETELRDALQEANASANNASKAEADAKFHREERDAAHRKIAEFSAKLDSKTEKLVDREAELRKTEATLFEVQASLSEVQSTLDAIKTEHSSAIASQRALEERADADLREKGRLQNELSTWINEVVTLSRLLREKEKTREELVYGQDTRFNARNRRASSSVIVSIVCSLRALARGEYFDRRLIVKSELFDPDWYLEHYSDVANSDWNPLDHFLAFGAKEGRDPSAGFSTNEYLKMNEDVAKSGMNPLVHYLRFGRNEGRQISSV